MNSPDEKAGIVMDWGTPDMLGGKLGSKPETMSFLVKHTPGASKATISGNNDIVEVAVVDGGTFRSFIERTPGGGVHVMSIATDRNVKGAFLAAYSRHAVLMGSLIVSQYRGSCE